MCACEDSLYLKRPMIQTILANDADTIVVIFNRQTCIGIFPEEMQRGIIKKCTENEPRYQERIAECLRGINVTMSSKEHEHKLNQVNKMSFPAINRAASKSILTAKLHKEFEGNEKVFEGQKFLR